MARPQNGIWVAPTVRLTATVGFNQAVRTAAHIHSLELGTGPTPGMARITFPALYAENVKVTVGSQADIRIGTKVVFRGVVLTKNTESNGDVDLVGVDLACDKHRLANYVLGQPDVGTMGAGLGFRHVGFDLVFNRDGRGNKHASELDFDMGSTGVKWTYATILQFLLAHFADEDFSLVTASFNSAWTAQPAELDLTGKTVTEAIEILANEVGQSWGMRFTASASEILAIPPAGYGSPRRAFLFEPNRGGRAAQAGEWHADQAKVLTDAANLRDVHYAVSGPVLVEATYSTEGEHPLLRQSEDFLSPKYALRLEVDVTKYAQNNLGQSLSAGAAAKPWMPTLLTRTNTDGSAYVTTRGAAEPRAEPALWIKQGSEYKLVVGGFEVDVENAFVFIEPTIEVSVSDTSKQPISISSTTEYDWRFTVATKTEVRLSAVSGFDSPYLPYPRALRLEFPDLVPELKLAGTVLPDLEDPADVLTASENLYFYNPTAELTAYAAASRRRMSALYCSMDVSLAFFPIAELGNPFVLSRDLGQTGTEYIRHITYTCHDGFRTKIKAENTPAAGGLS